MFGSKNDAIMLKSLSLYLFSFHNDPQPKQIYFVIKKNLESLYWEPLYNLQNKYVGVLF